MNPVTIVARVVAVVGASALLLASPHRTRPGSPVPTRHGASAAGTSPLRAFVTNERDGTITVIDVATNRVATTFRVGGRPRGICLSRDGRLYVALSHFRGVAASGADGVVALRPDNGEVLARYEVGPDPEGVAVDRRGDRLYVSNEDPGTMTAVDVATGRVVAVVPVGMEPEGVTVSPDDRWVYMTSETSSTISVLDATTGRMVASFLSPARPRAIVFSPVRGRAYGTAEVARSVFMIDTVHRRIARTLPIAASGSSPVGLAVSPDGSRIYVANGHADSVSIVNAAPFTVSKTIAVGRRPWGIAVTPDGRRLYTANGLSNDVSVVDTADERVVATIAAGQSPWGVAVGPLWPSSAARQ